MTTPLAHLLDKTITEVWVEAGEHRIAFVTDQGILGFSVEGDCCSESWFSDIYNLQGLFGGRVTEVQELDYHEWLPFHYNVDDGRGRQQEDSAYGFMLKTTKGTSSLVFRNSSNGYYGGSLSEEVVELDEIPKGFRRIEGDDWKC